MDALLAELQQPAKEEEQDTEEDVDQNIEVSKPVADEVDEVGASTQKKKKRDNPSLQIRTWTDLDITNANATVRAKAHVAETDYSFEHSDEDSIQREVSEIFSYWEWKEVNACHDIFINKYPEGFQWWLNQNTETRRECIEQHIDLLEAAELDTRRESAQILLHLSLGIPDQRAAAATADNEIGANGGLGLGATLRAFAKPSKDDRPVEADAFTLALETNDILKQCSVIPVFGQCLYSTASKLLKYADSQTESDLRLYANLLCVYLQLGLADKEFCNTLGHPCVDGGPLIDTVIEILMMYGANPAIGLPVRKLVLLLWKLVVGSMGSRDDISALKDSVRLRAGLNPTTNESSHTKTRPYHADNFEMETQEKIERGAYHISPSIALHINGSVPHAVAEASAILKKTVYVPPSELQRRVGDPPVLRGLIQDPSPVEALYRLLLPILPEFCVQLLKILLASLPMETYDGALNLTSELGQRNPGSVTFDSIGDEVQWTMDYARHKEVLAKAVSSFLLVVLKHMRFNHIYQYEYWCQLLVDFNMVVLVLKYLNQDLASHLEVDGDMQALEMLPREQSGVDTGDRMKPYSWRNFSTTLNMLRILQKLTKRNPLRIKIVMQYKGTATIKELLKIKHPLIRLYSLKLLKNQIKYLGAKWKKTNMKIISAIYTHVRPEMCDDWLVSEFGVSDVSLYTKQDQEFRHRIIEFNKINYQANEGTDGDDLKQDRPEDFQDLARYKGSVRGMHLLLRGKKNRPKKLVPVVQTQADPVSDQLDPEFQANYEPWLTKEVLWDDTTTEDPVELLK